MYTADRGIDDLLPTAGGDIDDMLSRPTADRGIDAYCLLLVGA